MGYGLGSLFGALARGVAPILKSAGKTLLRSGAEVLGDVISGDRDFSEAVRERGLAGLKSVGRNVTNKVLSSLDQPASGVRRQRKPRKRKSTPPATKQDIFNQKRRRNTRTIPLG